MTATTKLAGFTAETVAALESAGWVRGTECGYKHHAGFCITTKYGTDYGLVAGKKSGTYQLYRVRNGLAESSTYLTLPEVLAYFG